MISAATLIMIDRQLDETIKKDMKRLVGLHKTMKTIKKDEDFTSVVESKHED